MSCSFKWKEFANACVAKIKEIAKFTIIAVIGISISIPIVAGIGYIAVHLFGVTIAIQALSPFDYYSGVGGIILVLLLILLRLVLGIYEIKQYFTVCEKDDDETN
jgi:hypothetical protein